ncbi:MAG: hypothetical protein HQM07_06825 [Zetaproteobacteria bacterium]|nr:hypothetical protein [Zetaproteobacteria bacterium]
MTQTTSAPLPHFSTEQLQALQGRMIVILPTQRYQLLMQWHQLSSDEGNIVLTHAASGRIAEMAWHKPQMYWRDNHDQPNWSRMTEAYLHEKGMVLKPWEISQLLQGKMFAHFKSRDGRVWEGTFKKQYLKIEWIAEKGKLLIESLTKGQQAILILQ